VSSFVTSIPTDAKVEEMIRYDHSTEVGHLIEIWIPRRKKLPENALKGNRFRYIKTRVETTTPLILAAEPYLAANVENTQDEEYG